MGLSSTELREENALNTFTSGYKYKYTSIRLDNVKQFFHSDADKKD